MRALDKEVMAAACLLGVSAPAAAQSSFTARPAEEAERLRQRISQYIAKDVEGLDAPVTASMGIAVLGPETSLFGAMKLADISLYEAKAKGRNRIVKSGGKRAGKMSAAA